MFALDLSLAWDRIGTPQGGSEDTTQNENDLPFIVGFRIDF